MDAAKPNEDGNASEVAQAVVQMLPGFSEEDRRALKRLLSHHLAVEAGDAIRDARLGLLIEMFERGLDPSTREYELERKRRKELGESWPVASTLLRAYGHWLTAKAAAERLATKPGARVRPDEDGGQVANPSYTDQDVTDAIRLCARALGPWPTEWEYTESRRLSRAAAKYGGNEVDIPGSEIIRRLFGDYPAALQAAIEAERLAVEAGRSDLAELVS